jgi:hypothetical protein
VVVASVAEPEMYDAIPTLPAACMAAVVLVAVACHAVGSACDASHTLVFSVVVVPSPTVVLRTLSTMPGVQVSPAMFSALMVVPRQTVACSDEVLAHTRQALREERKLELDYVDVQQRASLRTVWPCALGFFEQVSVLVAWCETRNDFRHFRTDRIRALRLLDARYPRRRLELLREWRQNEGIDPPSL